MRKPIYLIYSNRSAELHSYYTHALRESQISWAEAWERLEATASQLQVVWPRETIATAMACLGRGSVGDCHEQGSYFVVAIVACTLKASVKTRIVVHDFTMACLGRGSV